MTYRVVLSIADMRDLNDLEVESDDPNELLWDAMKRAIERRHDRERADSFQAGGWAREWWWSDPDDPEYSGLFVAGTDLTIRQMVAFVGDDAERNGLSMAWGWGGGGPFSDVETILELVGDGTLVWGGITFARKKLRGIIDAKRARLMADYRDSGNLPMELRQEVLARRQWQQDGFLRKFATDPATAAKVMQDLKYRANSIDGKRYWIEDTGQ